MDSRPPATAHGTPSCVNGTRSERDSLQTRRAEAIDGLRGGRNGITCANGALAGDVRTRRAFRVGAAPWSRLPRAPDRSPCAFDGVFDDVAAEVGAVRHVEGAAHGAADGGAGQSIRLRRQPRCFLSRVGSMTSRLITLVLNTLSVGLSCALRGARFGVIRRRQSCASPAPAQSVPSWTACRLRSWQTIPEFEVRRQLVLAELVGQEGAQLFKREGARARLQLHEKPSRPRHDSCRARRFTITSATPACS